MVYAHTPKMTLTLQRTFKGSAYTIGKLALDGTYYCDTLEDPVRELPAVCPNTARGIPCTCEEKIYGETAIPAGTYRITLEHSSRFKRVLPYLHNVPHFLGVLIHSGNTSDDSSGCILVGENRVAGKVLDSRITSDRLNAILASEKDITIRIE